MRHMLISLDAERATDYITYIAGIMPTKAVSRRGPQDQP